MSELSEADRDLKRRGFCLGSGKRTKKIDDDRTSVCPLCERRVRVTKAGHFSKHKAVLVPSGWKDRWPDSPFFEKGTTYGNKYRCKECGCEALGLGGSKHNHYSRCSSYKP